MFTKSLIKFSSFSIPSISLSVLSFAFAASALIGCAADTAHPVDESAHDQKQPEQIVEDPVVSPVTIDENSKGKTVAVSAGQAIIVRLPSNGTTGYEWSVSSDATPLGQPDVSYVPPSSTSAPGAGGSTSFTWANTKTAPLGTYTIALQYKRSWEPDAIDSFSFVVELAH
jgi:predicted secreted protein